jgi:hypothetical protein
VFLFIICIVNVLIISHWRNLIIGLYIAVVQNQEWLQSLGPATVYTTQHNFSNFRFLLMNPVLTLSAEDRKWLTLGSIVFFRILDNEQIHKTRYSWALHTITFRFLLNLILCLEVSSWLMIAMWACHLHCWQYCLHYEHLLPCSIRLWHKSWHVAEWDLWFWNLKWVVQCAV